VAVDQTMVNPCIVEDHEQRHRLALGNMRSMKSTNVERRFPLKLNPFSRRITSSRTNERGKRLPGSRSDAVPNQARSGPTTVPVRIPWPAKHLSVETTQWACPHTPARMVDRQVAQRFAFLFAQARFQHYLHLVYSGLQFIRITKQFSIQFCRIT